MNTLTLMVGLPRSGKSTWAMEQGCPVVNPDSIRLALHGESFIPSAEPMVWTLAEYMVRSLFITGHPRVILDATNLTVKSRARWINQDWITDFALVQTLYDECVYRAQETGKPELIPVIQRMKDSFEIITAEERGPGKIYYTKA